mmetsp:Transcript_28627/g.66341  ORF Transcript_28627/g.66341 Transcript_28627/m.66341 type:complete len:153 (+) Transcript_28627:77-535(+)
MSLPVAAGASVPAWLLSPLATAASLAVFLFGILLVLALSLAEMKPLRLAELVAEKKVLLFGKAAAKVLIEDLEAGLETCVAPRRRKKSGSQLSKLRKFVRFFTLCEVEESQLDEEPFNMDDTAWRDPTQAVDPYSLDDQVWTSPVASVSVPY